MSAFPPLPGVLPTHPQRASAGIGLSAAGEFAVDDHTVPASGIAPALALRLAQPGNQDVLVVVRADRQVPFSVIRHTLDEARAAGARRLAIATRQRAEGRS